MLNALNVSRNVFITYLTRPENGPTDLDLGMGQQSLTWTGSTQLNLGLGSLDLTWVGSTRLDSSRVDLSLIESPMLNIGMDWFNLA